MADFENPLTSNSVDMTQLRHLSHDLSNALEVVIQTSFLLGTLDLGENGRKWHVMLDSGVQKATAINRELRKALQNL